jgi:hypothetical protein
MKYCHIYLQVKNKIKPNSKTPYKQSDITTARNGISEPLECHYAGGKEETSLFGPGFFQ